MRLGWPQSQSGHGDKREKIGSLPLPGIEPLVNIINNFYLK
jgi:hypothetical protein